MIAASLALASASPAAPRVERGNLVFDGVPDAPAPSSTRWTGTERT